MDLAVPLPHSEVHSPPSPSVPAWHHSYKQSPYCKSVSDVFIWMLQVFHLDVAKVDRKCCTCCSGYTYMFQVYVSNVSSRFSDVCLQVFHPDVAYVFTHMKCFQVCFASVLYACLSISAVSYVCCKCCIRMFQK
jgi:hypothetical protein